MRIVHVAAAALFSTAGEVLVARRPQGKPMAGLWEFPGGKVEPGETPEAALTRELDEELGIHISGPVPLGFVSHGYDSFHLVMLLFAVTRWHGEPRGRQGQALRWADTGMLPDLAMPAADYPLLPAVIAAARTMTDR